MAADDPVALLREASLFAAIPEAELEALATRPRGGARRVVLLVSDGGAHDESDAVVEAARAAAGEGIEVWTAGLGTTRGVELETATGPVLDPSGAPVLTRLEDRLLADIARAGGGAFEDVSGERGLRSLVERLQEGEPALPTDSREPPDATLLLALLGLALILVEGALDGRRGVRRTARTGEAW